MRPADAGEDHSSEEQFRRLSRRLSRQHWLLKYPTPKNFRSFSSLLIPSLWLLHIKPTTVSLGVKTPSGYHTPSVTLTTSGLQMSTRHIHQVPISSGAYKSRRRCWRWPEFATIHSRTNPGSSWNYSMEWEPHGENCVGWRLACDHRMIVILCDA